MSSKTSGDAPQHAPNSPEEQLRLAALEYHRSPIKGKIQVTATKPLSNQRDLSLAYSPGVAYPCLDIERDPALAADFTSRGNLVAVITNGTAVLGLGDIGPLAAKPVMEGKGVLFKKFAGIDVFDIELNEKDLDKLVDIIAALHDASAAVLRDPAMRKRLNDMAYVPVGGTPEELAAMVKRDLGIAAKIAKQAKIEPE